MRKLERNLGLFSVIAISISSMLGSGIFVLPGIAFSQTGASTSLAYLIALITILPAAISKSELATAMPSSGGTYVYLERTFGPLAGTIAGIGLWISILLKSTFALIGLSAYLNVLTSIDLEVTALLFIFIITILNILGVGKATALLVLSVILSLGGLFILNITILVDSTPFITITEWFPNGVKGLLSCSGLVFVSYAGVTKVAAIAEEIKEPEKNLPRGIMISLLTVSFVYCFTTFIMAHRLPIESIQGNLKPLYTLAQNVGGDLAGIIISIIGILTMTSVANSGILAASRFPFAMSRDKLIPSFIGKLNQRFLTPVWSILFSSAFIVIAVIYLDITRIVKLASAFILIIYMFENIAIIVLRETRVQWYRPVYKSKFYPLLQILGILASTLLLYQIGRIALIGVIGISIPAFLIFFLYGKKKTSRRGVIGIRGKRADLVDDRSYPTSLLETMDLSRDASVVVALLGKERSPEMLVEMGLALLKENHSLEVAHLTEAPEQTVLSDFNESRELRSLKRRIIAMSLEKNLSIVFDPIISHDISKTIYDISQRLHCKWLLMEWKGPSRGTFTIFNPLDWLKNHLDSNIAIFRDTGVRYIRKILVILEYHFIDKIVIDTATQLANVNTANLTFATFITENTSEKIVNKYEYYIKEQTENLSMKKNIMIIRGEDKVTSIQSTSVEFDLLIFGTTSKYSWFNRFGTIEDKIIATSACSVIAIHTGKQSKKLSRKIS